MIPSKPLSALSPAALDTYRKGIKDFDHQVKVTTDNVLAMAAATEVAEAGYGTLHVTQKYDSTLRVTPIAKGFSVARRDDGPWAGHLYIEVEVLRTATSDTGVLLACLYGATFENKTNGRAPWPTWTAQVRHATAKDSDHSASILADLTVNNPVLDRSTGFETTYIGILGEARMWPTGTDITLIDSNRGTALDEPDICTYSPRCEAEPHPFGPYQPTAREDLAQYTGRPVRITTIALPMVGENGMLASRTPVTHAGY